MKLKNKVLVDIGDGDLWSEKELSERCFKYTIYNRYFYFDDIKKAVESLIERLEEARTFYKKCGFSYEQREAAIIERIIELIKEYFADIFEETDN